MTAAGVLAALRAAGVEARAGYFGGVEIRVKDAAQLAELLGVTAEPAAKETADAH